MNSNANVMDTVENAMEPVQDSARTAARTGSQELRNLVADVDVGSRGRRRRPLRIHEAVE